MFKKRRLVMCTLVIIGVILMFSYPVMYASATEKNDVIFDKDIGAFTYINPDVLYVAHSDAAEEFEKQLRYVPDSVLSSSTEELLVYFLQSDFMLYQRCREGLLSSPDLVRFVDYITHPAFKELVTRKDFPAVLENYVKTLLMDSKFTEDIADIFEKLLEQPAIQSLIFERDDLAQEYPNLQSIYTQSQASTAAIGDLVWTIGDIDYYSAGTINTANGNLVVVGEPERELTTYEVNICNSISISGATRVNEPTAVYNCHSYAWYYTSIYNPYWICDVGPFIDDNACSTAFDVNSAQVNDIVVYLNENGVPLHSGVVSSIDSSGNLIVKSKWGQAGVYIHAIDSVPSAYCISLNSQEVWCLAFRYHNYKSVYTGNNYHSGHSRYLEYIERCEVCQISGETTWKAIICNGPPCSLIMPVAMLDE